VVKIITLEMSVFIFRWLLILRLDLVNLQFKCPKLNRHLIDSNRHTVYSHTAYVMFYLKKTKKHLKFTQVLRLKIAVVKTACIKGEKPLNSCLALSLNTHAHTHTHSKCK